MSGLLMVYDTETTDRTDFKAAYDASHQPNLVQIGYRVFDPATREVIFEVGHLVDSTTLKEWKGIAPGAQAVHGITEESLRNYGSSVAATMQNFQRWAERCSTFVAHNDQFDASIMQCFAKRAGYSPAIFSTGSKFCTMRSTTNICKVPHKDGRAGNKWPTLMEAYTSLIDERGFKGAHNALADVIPCGEIFWHLVDQGYITHKGGGIYAPR